MRSEGIDCTRTRDLIAVRRVISRDFVHVFPSFTDDFLLFPSDVRGGSLRLSPLYSSFGQPIDRRGSVGGGRGGPAGREKLGGNKKKKNVFKKLINSKTEVQSQPKRKIGGQLALSVYYRRNIVSVIYYIIIIIVYTSGAERSGARIVQRPAG